MQRRESRSQRLMAWIRAHLDDRGQIDRRLVQAKAREFGLSSANHLYGTEHPMMVQVPGTRYGRPA